MIYLPPRSRPAFLLRATTGNRLMSSGRYVVYNLTALGGSMKNCCIVIFLALAAFGFALDNGEHQAFSYEHPVLDGYMVWVPAGYSDSKAWPVILSLHSAAEVGGPVERALEHGPSAVIIDCPEEAYDFLRDEFIIISPHMTEGEYEECQWYLYTDTLNDILLKVGREYRLDEKRMYLVGYSTGATGVWGYLSRCPDQFAAAIAICGYTSPTRNLSAIIEDYDGFVHVPLWVFHNVWDNVVSYRHSSEAIKVLESRGAEPFLRKAYKVDKSSGRDRVVIDYEEAEVLSSPHIFSNYKIYIHDHGNLYENPILYRWLLSHTK
jgi:predicted peptidase